MSFERRAMEAALDAYRRETTAAADGRATRARVLAKAGQGARRRAFVRRAMVVVTITVVAALSGSAAWTAIGRWRQARASSPAPTAPRAVAVAPVDVAPPVAAKAAGVAPVAPPPAKPAVDEEARAYGRAHVAHFEADEPRRALALWDAYLARFPTATFAPEARFNRALCLLRLGRRAEARAALEPFAAGAYGRYRQREARSLLDWTEASSAP